MPTLEIYRDEKHDFDLARVLDAIEPLARRLNWYVVEFVPVFFVGQDGTHNTPPPDWVPPFWRQIQGTDNPTKVAWARLRAFAGFVGQTDIALMVGLDTRKAPPREPIDVNDPQFAVVIQALDGNIWSITTRNASLIKSIRAQFPNAKTVVSTQRYY